MPRRSPPPGRWYPPLSRPRPAEGIKTKSRTGAIGATWWSQRFIAVLESFDMGARLTRGRRYARSGQVLDLDVAAGEMPEDIEDAFTDCRLHLFPASAADLATDCTCPDRANPCKHIAATYYVLAEAFDDDPFLILTWRGRTKAELLARLEAQPESALARPAEPGHWTPPEITGPALDECLDRFFDTGELPTPTGEPGAVVPHALLLGLDDPPIEIRGRALADVLRPAYATITEAARHRLLDEPPSPPPA